MKRIVVLLVVISCSSNPARPAPTPDRDGLSTPLGQTCAKLRAVGCSDGLPSQDGRRTCYERLVDRVALVPVPTECVVREATDLEGVRRCGGPSTLRFRCP